MQDVAEGEGGRVKLEEEGGRVKMEDVEQMGKIRVKLEGK